MDTQNESNNQVADDWYYAENGQSVGPFSEEQMWQFLRTNKIYGETYVYKKGLPDWIPLKQSELFEVLLMRFNRNNQSLKLWRQNQIIPTGIF